VRVKPFIFADRATEHLHNQFICGILGNVIRDPPEQPVASWVSANDKPSTLAKQLHGDEVEQRLKTEVMSLSAKERHRIKSIQEVRSSSFFWHNCCANGTLADTGFGKRRRTL
jgi:transcriptional coactivator HFI1/ADA1